MKTILHEISQQCVECGKCSRECGFLTRHGNPKQIADRYIQNSMEDADLAYGCSLCGLCTSVCPAGLRPADLFLEMRRDAIRKGQYDLSPHAGLLAYEKRGTSKRFTWYGLPEACDTIFFPGCTFAGTRPERTREIFAYMRRYIPNLGIVLDCCTKPSHDLGRQDYFTAMFGEMKSFLIKNGVRNVLVACPNCYRVFRDYGDGLRVKTVYTFFVSNGLRFSNQTDQQVAVHDPCALRFEGAVHADIRNLIRRTGISVVKMKHEQTQTICCGEGGDVGRNAPDLAAGWIGMRKAEAGPLPLIAYCAGCVNYLRPHVPTHHVLDLIFAPEQTLAGRTKIKKAPFTYLHRLKMKRDFRRSLDTAVTRERPTAAEERKSIGSRAARLADFLLHRRQSD